MTEQSPAYRALALQTRCDAVNGLGVDAAREQMQQSIKRIGRQVMASKGFVGQDTRLIVLPEYFLTSFPMGESIPEWSALAALQQNGPEYEALGKVAQDAKVFLSGNAYEVDPHFPDLYFQTSFIINDSGDIVLRYRRLQSLFAPSPWDVWDRYLEHYGEDGVFPVADTELGKLATIASEEILYPEIARALGARGAEVFLHSTSEVGSPTLTPKDVGKRARAFENNAYLVSANSAGIAGIAIPEASTDGMSKIVDFNGLVQCEAGYGETMVANAELDLGALRRWRRRPGMQNMLARQKSGIFAGVYGDDHGRNALLDGKGQPVVPDRAHFIKAQQGRIAKLQRDKLI
ncbi:MAG: nitrilase-related carbon-nitrogen hydrolase [Pseudomonadota bacterium]